MPLGKVHIIVKLLNNECTKRATHGVSETKNISGNVEEPYHLEYVPEADLSKFSKIKRLSKRRS